MAQIGSFVFLGAFLSTQITTSDAAFPCTAGGLHVSKANQADITCSKKDCKYSECCDYSPDICINVFLDGTSCAAGKTYDPAASGSDVATCCVLDKASCSAYSCPAGSKLKTGTEYCSGSTCDVNDKYNCCDRESTKCVSHTCGTGKKSDETKDGDTGDTDALCCKDRSTCASATSADAELGGEADITEACAAIGWMYDTTKASENVGSACCKADATFVMPTCSSYVAAAAAASGARQFASTHHTFAMLFCVLISSVKQL